MTLQIIFDNILNMKIPWPSVPGDMSYEAQDLINRLVLFFAFEELKKKILLCNGIGLTLLQLEVIVSLCKRFNQLCLKYLDNFLW